jgi:quercetin dioxygenase-like cupin family protein
MQRSKTLPTVIMSFLALAGVLVFAKAGRFVPIMVLPDEVKWAINSPPPQGPQTVVLAGDPQSAGLYTVRIRIPADAKLQPHWHPDDRTVVVISGTLYYGYGDEFDEAKLRELPPGSFFTEPSRQPHFAWARAGEVVVQATGIGPSGTTFVHSSDTSRH